MRVAGSSSIRVTAAVVGAFDSGWLKTAEHNILKFTILSGSKLTYISTDFDINRKCIRHFTTE